MTTASTSQYGAGDSSSSWGLPLAIGILDLLVGLVLLFNFGAAVATLVLLAGLSLLMASVSEIALTNHRTAGTWFLAAVFFIGGVLALAWPGMTLWALAVVVGVSLMVAGAVRSVLAIAERRETRHWGWMLAGGIVTFAIGVLAISWPGATVAVLALFLAIRIIVAGVVNLVAAKYMYDARV